MTLTRFTRALLIQKHHPALAGHFPGNPIVPGVVLMDQIQRLWFEHTGKLVTVVWNAKFTSPLKSGVNCEVEYFEKNSGKVNFHVTTLDRTSTLIAKGQFGYE